MSGRAITANVLAEIQKGHVRPAILVSIETASGTVRAWSGVGDIVFAGDTYNGVGNLGGISEIKETSNLEANGCNFTLSGIPGSLISTALGQIQYGRPAKAWLAFVDAAGALVLDPYLMFSGLTDNATINESPDSPSITISAESRFIDLDRQRVRRYTPEDQAIDHPGDKGFDFVASLQDAQIIFGGN